MAMPRFVAQSCNLIHLVAIALSFVIKGARPLRYYSIMEKVFGFATKGCPKGNSKNGLPTRARWLYSMHSNSTCSWNNEANCLKRLALESVMPWFVRNSKETKAQAELQPPQSNAVMHLNSHMGLCHFL